MAGPYLERKGTANFVWDTGTLSWVRMTQPGGGGGSGDTELPAAAALADGTANPTAPIVGAFGQLWNGATWDRSPGDATYGAKTISPAVVDSGNSTTSTLNASAVFTGTGRDVLRFSSVSVSGIAVTASDGDPTIIYMEFSSDNTNWDLSEPVEIKTGVGFHIVRPIAAQYWRIRVSNTSVRNHSALRIQTLLVPGTLIDTGHTYGPITVDAVNKGLSAHVRNTRSTGFRLVATSASLTIKVGASFDGGLSYQVINFANAQTGAFIDGNTGYVLASSSETAAFQIFAPAGATHVQVYAAAYTSGSIALALSTGDITLISGLEYAVTNSGTTPQPPAGIQLGGSASAGGQFNTVRATDTTPATNAQGLVTRDPAIPAILSDSNTSYTGKGFVVLGRAGSTAFFLPLDSNGRPNFQDVALVTTRRFQNMTPSDPTFATVGTSSASAIAGNNSRNGLVLVNTSNNVISLGFGDTAVLYSGVTLYPGGSYTMGDGNFSNQTVNAIASAAGSNLAIQEFTKDAP